MRYLATLTLFGLIGLLQAAELKTKTAIPYAESKNDRQLLDVYTAPDFKNQPVAVWIHGGGWRAGDKMSARKKAQPFVDKGVVLVAVNYRFVPQVTVKEMTADIAKAIRWVHDHAAEFGGDSKSIYVMGHSAGAHLAALVCTDDRYLKAEGLPMSILKGCVPVDTAAFDVPKQIDGGRALLYTSVFGKTEASQREYSPITHVAKGKSIPPFLLLHVADRADSKAQAHHLADRLKEAGVPAQVVAAEGTNHGTINANLGKADDRPTQELWKFMKR